MLSKNEIRAIVEEIGALTAKLPDSPSAYSELSRPERARLRNSLESALHKLETVEQSLDQVALPSFVFDPTEPRVIGKLVAETLLLQPRQRLAEVGEKRFYGAGVYAIYYKGAFDAYRLLSGKDYPLYVGKADPEEMHAAKPREQGERLSSRLRDHCRSIRGTVNLKVEDFDCRYLVVRSAWVETAEDHLIASFRPIWNKETGVCYGFGKHGDAPETRANRRSPWDTLHPGRKWATRDGNAPGASTVREIKRRIVNHLESCGLGETK